nr:MAG TPA: hypothetical protein [Caudoviricetes sp.]
MNFLIKLIEQRLSQIQTLSTFVLQIEKLEKEFTKERAVFSLFAISLMPLVLINMLLGRQTIINV